jgi:hypothetical protein
MRSHPRLRDLGEALIAAANEAGGRDNITVVLFRLEDPSAPASQLAPETREEVVVAPAPADSDGRGDAAAHADVAALAEPAAADVVARSAAPVTPVRPRKPRMPAPAPVEVVGRRRMRRLTPVVIVLVVLGLLASGAYLAAQSVYFIGTNARGLVTLYNGFPYQLPGGIKLYSSDYVSGVSASTLSPVRRRSLLDHSLYSESKASGLIRSLELGQLSE